MEPTKTDVVKVKVLTRMLVGRSMRENSTMEETYAEPGEVISMPRGEAEKLAGRNFEGYMSRHDEEWRAEAQGNVIQGGTYLLAHPAKDGRVRDPLVEIL